MQHLFYVDLPQIPEEVILPIHDIINGKPHSVGDQPNGYDFFQVRVANTELVDWINANLPFKCHIQYQVVYHTLPIHRDVGDNLSIVMNYILRSGGPNVITTIYEDDYTTPNTSLHIEERRWHQLDITRPHGVSGILPDEPRVAIRATPLWIW